MSLLERGPGPLLGAEAGPLLGKGPGPLLRPSSIERSKASPPLSVVRAARHPGTGSRGWRAERAGVVGATDVVAT